MAGLLGMGGMNAAPQGLMQFPGFDPRAQRNQMLKNGLLQMGISLLSQGPSQYPVGIGQAIGQGLGAGAQGANEAKQDYQQQGLLSMQMADAQRKRKEEEEQSAARNAWINTLDPQQQSLARFAPGAVAGAQASTFYQKPEAPKTREIRIGSEQVTQEWNPSTGSWSEVGRGAAFSDKPLVSIGGDNDADTALRAELSKKQGEQWSEIVQQGTTSAGMIQDLEIMDELAKHAPQGAVTGRLVEMFPGVNSAGDAFESVAKRVAPSLRTPGAGSTSDVEYEGFLKAMPRLRNTEGGNKIISSILAQKAALNVERAQIVTAYMNEEISASQARKRLAEVNKRSILSPELKGVIDRASGADLKQKYGLEE